MNNHYETFCSNMQHERGSSLMNSYDMAGSLRLKLQISSI